MLRVTSTRRPARVIEPAEAVVVADAPTNVGAVEIMGLAALQENPDLVNFGIRGHETAAAVTPLPAGTYTVFAERD